MLPSPLPSRPISTSHSPPTSTKTTSSLTSGRVQPVDQAILAEPLNGLLFQLNGQPWVYATSLATSELVGYARSASITDAQRGTINTLFGIDIRQAVTLTRELITELTATDTGILFDEDGNVKTHDALDDTFDIFEAAILFDTYMTDNAATRNTFNTYFGIDPTLQVFTNPDYRDRLFAIVGDLDYADPATFFADLIHRCGHRRLHGRLCCLHRCRAGQYRHRTRRLRRRKRRLP